MYGRAPRFVDYFPISLPEVMYYLYLPVRMPQADTDYDLGRIIEPIRGPAHLRLPPALECLRPMVAKVLHDHPGHAYAYVSARRGWATPDNPLNRPGWHCDGFGTDDLNFVWWDGPGTRFSLGDFGKISDDHIESMKQFDQRADMIDVQTYPQHALYMIDRYVVHATPILREGCYRQYVKISLSNARYNLEGNSHNYLFNYDWKLIDRELVRNDPGRAQMDYT